MSTKPVARSAWLRFGWGMAAALLAVSASGAAGGLPATTRLEAFVSFATSHPDPAAIERFVAENWAASSLAERPAAVVAGRLRRVFDDLAGARLETRRAIRPDASELVFRTIQADLWITITVEQESSPPFGIVGLAVEADEHPAAKEGAVEPIGGAEALRRLDAEIDRRAAADEFSGVVLVVRDGEVLLDRAVGWADRGLRVANRPDTSFNLGSINKIFTMVVIHQLAAEGRLRLDAPLADALPDYPDAEVAARITIRQLLDHSSGLGDFFNDRYDATPRDRLRSLADYLPLFAGRPLEFEPGSRRSYSNAGYLVLGLVIEKLTGKSYYDAVRARVFERAGMSDTESWPVDAVVPNRAVGYTRNGDAAEPSQTLRSNVERLPGRGSSAGGGYSTAADLARFAAALVGGRLLPPGTEGPGAGFGIAGGSEGVNAVLEIGAPGEPTLVVLSNLDPPSAESLARFARGLLGRSD